MDKLTLTTDFTICGTVRTFANGLDYACARYAGHDGQCGGPLEPVERVGMFFAAGISTEHLNDLARLIHALIRSGDDSAEILMVAEAINQARGTAEIFPPDDDD